MKMCKQPHKAVYLEWVDSTAMGGVWIDHEKKPAAPDCHTLGWIIHEDSKTITVAAHTSVSTTSCAGALTIPKCAIKKRRSIAL